MQMAIEEARKCIPVESAFNVGAVLVRAVCRAVQHRRVHTRVDVAREQQVEDARGRRLGGRTSVHSGEGPLANPGSTNQFRMTAFLVPEFTTDVKLRVEGVLFTDRSRWPAGL